MSYKGINPGHVKTWRCGVATPQGKIDHARKLRLLYPFGYSTLCEMAEAAKGNRTNENLNPSVRKLNACLEDRQVADLMRSRSNIEAIEVTLDVAIHFVNGETNTVYVATSRPLIEQRIKT